MVEFDAKKFGLKTVEIEKKHTLGQLTKLYGFHFLPLIAIVIFLVKGFTLQVSVLAAAITGGDPFKTTMMAWKYAITAFLLPFIFVLLPAGRAMLLHWEGSGAGQGIWTIVAAFIGIGMLASGCSGRFMKRSNTLERFITIVGALAFIYPSMIGDVVGFVCLILVAVMQKARKSEEAPEAPAVAGG